MLQSWLCTLGLALVGKIKQNFFWSLWLLSLPTPRCSWCHCNHFYVTDWNNLNSVMSFPLWDCVSPVSLQSFSFILIPHVFRLWHACAQRTPTPQHVSWLWWKWFQCGVELLISLILFLAVIMWACAETEPTTVAWVEMTSAHVGCSSVSL